MLVDTHCHLNFKAFKHDSSEVVARAKEAGVVSIINVGSQWSTSVRGVRMAEKGEGLFASVALHPIHLYEMEVDEDEDHFTTKAEVFGYEKYKVLANSSSKVVAIGECGLDYYHWPGGVDRAEVKIMQQELFRQHINLASELNLPIIIHCRSEKPERASNQQGAGRDAYGDLLVILKNELAKGKLSKKGVAHCFLGRKEQAKRFLDLGFLLSFTGIITFKNASPELLEIVKQTPFNKIMVETDAPYLAPQAYRGTRNEPAYVAEVAKKIAELKDVSFEEVKRITTQNADQLFSLGIIK
ncbi:MAG: TatD family hydrolase [Patescibacteria group bacterium]